MNMKIASLLLVGIFSVLSGKAQPSPVTLPGSEARRFTSSIVAGQEYELQIMFPAGYEKSNKKYPVLYLMDSQWDFPLLQSLYGEQYYDGFIPEMMIVGVTWGGVHPNPDSLRARDYTPTVEKRLPQSGGADKFLSVLEKEVFPFVEANYKADRTGRTLAGCSLGGLFTMYALFSRPGMFQRYIATSPAFGWDNEVLYQYEKKYFENGANPPAKLFMCIGGVERSVPGFQKLTKHLSDRHYTTLQIQSRIVENTGHSGTKGEGNARGLQYVFERPTVTLQSDVLNKYAGTYQLENGGTATVKIEAGQPVLYFSPANKYFLKTASETAFYSTAEFFNLEFKKDGSGNVTGFQLERYGGTQSATKIK